MPSSEGDTDTYAEGERRAMTEGKIGGMRL